MFKLHYMNFNFVNKKLAKNTLYQALKFYHDIETFQPDIKSPNPSLVTKVIDIIDLKSSIINEF